MTPWRKLSALWQAGGPLVVAGALRRRLLFKSWRSLVFVHKTPVSASGLQWPHGYRYELLGRRPALTTAHEEALRRQGARTFLEDLADSDLVYAVWSGPELASYGAVMTRSPQHSVLGLPVDASLIGLCETAHAHRRNGLFTLALMHTVHLLRRQGQQEVFVEVLEENMPSRRGITKAGFDLWAKVDAQIWFGRWIRRGGRWHRVVRGH